MTLEGTLVNEEVLSNFAKAWPLERALGGWMENRGRISLVGE